MLEEYRLRQVHDGLLSMLTRSETLITFNRCSLVSLPPLVQVLRHD